MNRLTIKEYAIRHKLSIYNVVKMTKNGTLKSETEKIDGKDEVYILDNEDIASRPAMSKEAGEEKIEDYKTAYYNLKKEYEQLKRAYNVLQKKSDLSR